MSKIAKSKKDMQEKPQDTPARMDNPKEDALKEFKVQRHLKFQELAEENYNSAVGKFDTLIVSIAGGGLYVVFESLKFYKEKLGNLNYTDWSLNYAGVLFTASIIINLASQWTSFTANRYACEWSNQNIHQIKKDIRFKLEDHDRYKRLKDRFNSITSILNLLSAILLFCGIILLAMFQFNAKVQ